MNLLRNLWAGLKLGTLIPRVSARDFRASTDQVVALSFVLVALAWAGSYLGSREPRDFYWAAIESLAFRLVLTLGFAYFVTRFGSAGGIVALSVALVSLLAAERVLVTAVDVAEVVWPRLAENPGLRVVTFALWLWLAAVSYRAVRTMTSLSGLRVLLATVAYVAMLWSVLRVVPMEPFFATDTWSDAVHDEPHFDPERVMFAQYERIERALSTLEPQRSDVTDLYFVSFAGDATQDVFRSEAVFAQRLFDRRFDTRGRSIALVNSQRTLERRPLASATNLAAALKGIGEQMDRERDVLFLFLTSHGSRTPELSVEFPPLPLADVAPEDLREMLDSAGIQWRVIVISSCFSGGFTKILENDATLIMTASAADRESFGCSNAAQFTYFGRAFFRDALTRSSSFAEAFEQARERIGVLERSEGVDASQPQMVMGDEIRAVLRQIEQRVDPAQTP